MVVFMVLMFTGFYLAFGKDVLRIVENILHKMQGSNSVVFFIICNQTEQLKFSTHFWSIISMNDYKKMCI